MSEIVLICENKAATVVTGPGTGMCLIGTAILPYSL